MGLKYCKYIDLNILAYKMKSRSRDLEDFKNILLEVEPPPKVDDDASAPTYGTLDGDVPAASISSPLRCCTYFTKLACFKKLARKIDDSWWYINAGN